MISDGLTITSNRESTSDKKYCGDEVPRRHNAKIRLLSAQKRFQFSEHAVNVDTQNDTCKQSSKKTTLKTGDLQIEKRHHEKEDDDG